KATLPGRRLPSPRHPSRSLNSPARTLGLSPETRPSRPRPQPARAVDEKAVVPCSSGRQPYPAPSLPVDPGLGRLAPRGDGGAVLGLDRVEPEGGGGGG